jgi:ribonuclease P protein component
VSHDPLKAWSRLSGPSRFEAVMSVRPCARSAHFMVHFLAAGAVKPKLSTARGVEMPQAVDESLEISSESGAVRLGLVVPKRHAKRAVTRNLVKREFREAVDRHLQHLACGDWVLRLRAPIDRKAFISAKSPALAQLLRDEAETVLRDAVRRTTRALAGAPAHGRSGDSLAA